MPQLREKTTNRDRETEVKESELMMRLQVGIYRHYKGAHYMLVGVADHTEREERLAVYVSLEGTHLPGCRLRARPLSMWTEEVDIDGVKKPRFEFVGLELPNIQETGEQLIERLAPGHEEVASKDEADKDEADNNLCIKQHPDGEWFFGYYLGTIPSARYIWLRKENP